MRMQRVDAGVGGAGGDRNALDTTAEPAGVTPLAPTSAAAEINLPPSSVGRIASRVAALQSAWQVRRFAGSGHFGSGSIPRLMTARETIEVQHALDRLGPFGTDRIDNFARLHAAIISANDTSAHAVFTLVRHRIVPANQRGADGDTLLHSLIEHGRLQPAEGISDAVAPRIGLQERLTQLIAAGANPTATDRGGRTALERILSSTRPDWQTVGEALLAATPLPLFMHKVKDGPTLLHRAARRGETTLVARWLALELPTDIGAANWGDVADPEIKTPLRRALKNHSLEGLEIAHMLIAGGADPNIRAPWLGNSMLHRAACDADLPLIKGWIAAGLSLDGRMRQGQRMTALMLAIRHHPKREALITLIAQSSAIETRDAEGATAVHVAASEPKLFRTLEPLIAAGADLNVHDDQGRSPLEISIDIAFETYNDSAFWILAAHGADLDLANPITGQSPRTLYNRLRWRWDGAPLP